MLRFVGPNFFLYVFVCMSMQAPPPVHAAESCQVAVATAVAKSAGIKRKKSTQEDFVVAAACKLWPYDNKTLLSAIAFSTDNVDEKVLVVAMSDAKSGRVINFAGAGHDAEGSPKRLFRRRTGTCI